MSELTAIPFPELCSACEKRAAGHGHFAQFCVLCAELPYGVSADDYSEADRFLDMHWSNDQRWYVATLDMARRVPESKLSNVQLGSLVLFIFRRWVETKTNTAGIDQRLIDMMGDELARHGGFDAVNLAAFGESIRESMGNEA